MAHSQDRAHRRTTDRWIGDAENTRPAITTNSAEGEDDANEASPLLSSQNMGYFEPLPPLAAVPRATESDNRSISSRDIADESIQETKSSLYLFLLTLSIGGLQIAWSVELGSGSPYLLSLGLSKSLLAFVWIAGPLSGTLVQPYVGMKSDRCRSRFGKRRPFMVGGAVATVLSLLILAWAKEIVGAFFGFGRAANVVIAVAVVMIYVLDFSINVIQAGIRAFIVDNAPMHQQDSANAWASRVSGVGNIVGYLFSYADLPRYFWFLGDTQFKVLCVFASIAMLSTLTVSCVCISERDPRLESPPPKTSEGVLAFFKDLYHSTRMLPKQIKAVCLVQFFAWIGWFPFLFYISTYIAEIYVQPIFSANPNMTESDINATWEHATRIGTFALFLFAITTFVASVVLPFMVASNYGTPQLAPGKTSVSNLLRIQDLTLRRAWLLSHLLFALLMWLTLFVNSTNAATVLVSLVGIPWAITNWAPFALIAEEISKRGAIRRKSHSLLRAQGEQQVGVDDIASEQVDQAGVVLGIHNVAIAAPQVIATLVSSAIFRALQKPRGSVGDESMAWVLRFGGLAALVAGYLTRRVGEVKRF